MLLLPDDNESLQGERGRVELNTSKIKAGAAALGPDERSAGRELHSHLGEETAVTGTE